ncbi:EAL domain-containing protein [Alteromonas sp. 1_MG-2023]|uniref:bifunctional diguanylate cyclase/phosphodiesterase n=1 Tax=Alteromonas sp. 1_MG-2023 TaxID=3062669 RepID=UPI0026E23D68|nr:EAL domain-containing protein [Alteromonas sp. 1_MG-2023]MDO6566103.1 EAL domain-containing protein [Alteromonas sp. 1_MG-2023]
MIFRSTSFFTKQLFAVLSVNFLSLCLVAGLLYSNFISDYKNNLVNVLSSQSKLLASASRSSVLFNDAQSTQDLLFAASQLQATLTAKVYDAEFNLFAEYSREGVFDLTSPQQLPLGETFKDDALYFVEPVVFDQQIIGFLMLSASTDSLDSQQHQALLVVIGVLLLSMLLSYLLNFRLQKLFTSPIDKLISLIRKVAKSREYHTRLPEVRNDELGELFSGLNDILATVENHQEQLKAHNTELESLVELRTRQLYQRANYDALTHLPNRHLFVEQIELAINKANKTRSPLAVMFLDLDRFKLINDSLGHDIGDKVLVEVSKKLTEIVVKQDRVSRWGGDEFVVMVEELHSKDDLSYLANHIIASLSEPMLIEGHQLHISTSIGIAVYETQEENGISLLKHADTSMYHAKEQGPGQFCFFNDGMLENSMNRLSLEGQLRHALKLEDAFTMVYQPQICANTGHIKGMEALIRWQNAEGNYIPPSDFIPIAEEAGLINLLSVWILNRVSAQMNHWRTQGVPLVPVAINLPACFITQLDCAEQIADIMASNNIPPELIEVELTENTFISSTEFALTSLKKLKKLGFKVSIDDFGTGYSCLSYISTLPIDKLKIDGSFVQKLGKSKSNDGIVSAIVMLAKGLNLVTVGECVETEDQLIQLREMGCDIIQGYYYHPPLHVDAAAKLMLDTHQT